MFSRVATNTVGEEPFITDAKGKKVRNPNYAEAARQFMIRHGGHEGERWHASLTWSLQNTQMVPVLTTGQDTLELDEAS